MGFTGPSQSYILAETMDERVTIVVMKFLELWRNTHGPEVLPDKESCRKFIKSAVWKEALVCAHGYLHHMRDEVTMRVDQKVAHDIMLNGADVDQKLKLESLL